MSAAPSSAFIVGPKGREPEVISKDEHAKIRRLLEVFRSKAEQPLQEVLFWLLSLSAEQTIDGRGILIYMVYHYLVGKDSHGVLSGIFVNSELSELSERELEVLRNTLTALRAGGWFADWLALQVNVISNHKHPDDRFPSPLKIASSLSICMEEEEVRMEMARDVVEKRPDLFRLSAPQLESAPAKESAKASARKKAKRAA